MNAKIEALKLFLQLESIEDITESYENNFETPEGEFAVLTDSEADEACLESITQFIDECGITGFTPNFQEEIKNNYVDLSWFDEAMRESYEAYIEDIREEFEEDENGEEITRLQSEMNQADYEDEDAFLDYLCSDNAPEWYKDNFGESDYNEAIKNHCSLDIDAICTACIEWDGRGHQLSGYDGEENEQQFDGETYYIYRTN